MSIFFDALVGYRCRETGAIGARTDEKAKVESMRSCQSSRINDRKHRGMTAFGYPLDELRTFAISAV
jgi:hypothetical protein